MRRIGAVGPASSTRSGALVGVLLHLRACRRPWPAVTTRQVGHLATGPSLATRTPRKLRSAGVLVYRYAAAPAGASGALQVLLAHPGGPFFARKDNGAWTIPKGEIEPNEDELQCALRELEEETGIRPGSAPLLSLGEIRQRGGKTVVAWAFEGDWAGGAPRSNTFELEWPPRSGRIQSFPEIDRLELFELPEARLKINAAQSELLDRLTALLERQRSEQEPPR